MRTLAATISLSAVLLVACGPRRGHEEAAHAAESAGERPASDEKDDTVPLNGLRGIATSAAPAPRAEGAWFPAEAIGDVDARREITAPVAGTVTALRARPGRAVARGAILAELQSPELARLKADWLVARARRERAEADLGREERLFAAGAGSRRDVEVARADALGARADQEAARLAVEARGLSPETAGARVVIGAPATGSVSSWKARLGEGVTAGQALGEFQAGAAALARVELAPPAPSWRIGDATDVRSSDGRSWRASIDGVPASLGESRRLSYTLRLSGAPLPLPGLPLEARVPLAAGVILPQSALQQVEGIWGVFRREGSRARFVPVRRGAELGGDVLVLEGVAPGDDVVTEGAYLLKSLKLRRSGAEGEHEH